MPASPGAEPAAPASPALPRIYVTGAGGAIGEVLVATLRAQGCKVVALGRQTAPLPRADWLHKGDTDAAVVHLAGASRARAATPESPEDTAAPHLRMVADLIAQGWRGHLLFPSSAAVYGPAAQPIPESTPPAPPNAYGAGKLALERGLSALAARHGFTLSILRLANIYGTRQDARRGRVAGLLVQAALRGTPFTLYGNGSSRRDYLHVADLCRALQAVLERRPEDVLNLGSGQGTALATLIAEVERATGRSIPLHRLPPRPDESQATVLDPGRAQELLDWRPRLPLSQGVAALAALLRAEAGSPAVHFR